MTFDTPQISELIALKAKILLGIPEKHLDVPPLGVCLEYSGSFPPDLIGSEISVGTGKLFVFIADQNSDFINNWRLRSIDAFGCGAMWPRTRRDPREHPGAPVQGEISQRALRQDFRQGTSGRHGRDDFRPRRDGDMGKSVEHERCAQTKGQKKDRG
jgi:hypothetical protein